MSIPCLELTSGFSSPCPDRYSVPGMKNMRYSERFKYLKLPNLAHRHRSDILKCFKNCTSLDVIPCEKIFTTANVRTQGLSYKSKLKKRRLISFRLGSFSQHAITEWEN